MINKIELLAPAGSMEALQAAISAGANAVYLGGKSFGARAFAHNFDHDDMINAVETAHLHNVKVYVTMNTLLNDFELAAALQEVAFLYETGVDALLIQDLGLYDLIHRQFPDFEIHASTQMHIHNTQGVINAKRMGFKRAVVARETTISQMKEMCRQGIEVEVFVHGALCISYSGQCLMSSAMYSRSGNRGICAQCCRLPYNLYDYDEYHTQETKGEYLLSSHDLMGIRDIPDLIEAGVSSLKIEGRMKKPAYVAYITSMYRKAIDAYYRHQPFSLSDEEMNNISVLFNRGFTDTYYKDNADGKELYAPEQPNHRGILLGKIISVGKQRAGILLTEDIHQFDGIRIANQDGDGFIVNYLYDEKDNLVSSMKKGQIAYLKADFECEKDTLVYKTSDYCLEKSITENMCLPRIPLSLSLYAKIGEPLSLSGTCDGKTVYVCSDFIVQESKSASINEADLRKHMDHFNDSPYDMVDFTAETDERIFVTVKALKQCRRDFVEKMNRERLTMHRVPTPDDLPQQHVTPLTETIYESEQQENGITISENGDAEYLLYPVINPKSEYPQHDKIVVSEVGGLLLERKHKIAYPSLNVYNHAAVSFLRRLGFEAIIVSSELNEKERDELIKNLNEQGDKVHFFKEGKRDLMNFRVSPLTSNAVNAKEHRYALTFKREKYPIIERNNRTVLLENESRHIEDNRFYTFIRRNNELL